MLIIFLIHNIEFSEFIYFLYFLLFLSTILAAEPRNIYTSTAGLKFDPRHRFRYIICNY